MALLAIRLYGDPILRKRAAPITSITPAIRSLAADMLETMFDASGAGLAAPQVGESIRMLAGDASRQDGGDGPRVFINPEILEAWSEWTYEEGCLSIPGISAEIVRPEAIRVRFQDLEGQWHEEEMHHLWARILQHEIDHLNGKLFVDYMSPMRRALLSKKLKELTRESKLRVAL
jgi:peptide deformylase